MVTDATENEANPSSYEPLCRLAGRAALVQYFLDDLYLHVSNQSSAKLPYCTANASLLHFPALQHLVHHLWQTVALVVVLYDFYFHAGEAEVPRAALPVGADVVPQQIQMLLSHGVVL